MGKVKEVYRELQEVIDDVMCGLDHLEKMERCIRQDMDRYAEVRKEVFHNLGKIVGFAGYAVGEEDDHEN